MSITDQIRERVKSHLDKELFYLPPLFKGDPTLREVFVSVEVRDAVTFPFRHNWEGLRCSKFRATLDALTRGDTLSVAERPFDKPSDTFLARVDPIEDEIWDIRSIAPNPGIRCLGGFGGKNFFIALTWDYHESLCNGDDWRAEIQRCKSEWNRLFGSIPRFMGASLDEYLSNVYAV